MWRCIICRSCSTASLVVVTSSSSSRSRRSCKICSMIVSVLNLRIRAMRVMSVLGILISPSTLSSLASTCLIMFTMGVISSRASSICLGGTCHQRQEDGRKPRVGECPWVGFFDSGGRLTKKRSLR